MLYVNGRIMSCIKKFQSQRRTERYVGEHRLFANSIDNDVFRSRLLDVHIQYSMLTERMKRKNVYVKH
jgi:hypothetical protein